MAKYILFDTETTGNAPEDRIIQIGALVVHSRESIDLYDSLCKAPLEIKVEAMEVHHITPDLITDKPPYSQTAFAQVLTEFNHPTNYLIAHNIAFDLGMLEKEGFENHYTLIDTLRCAKHLLPDLPAHRLQYLRYALKLYTQEQAESSRLNITIKAHDAIGDVLVMKLLLSKLVALTQATYPTLNPIEQLATLTQTPVLIEQFKFGKYKGESLQSIASKDRGYLEWMQKNMELDEDMRFTLKHYLG